MAKTDIKPAWVVLPFTTLEPRLPLKGFESVDKAAEYARKNEPYLGAWTIRASHDPLIDWSPKR